ncbi:oxygenase MpaB family protein [Nocardioides sp. BP30]|uniref:oxygenase MpaB family protein n=1 Tax=Nocardioides sp. BP30 TaxID=3036374 RepID=UPI0024690743|nr:oxygenase MpaB family protein [Nocardioides sp. BP30]WGL53330.1 oxygenase MpaB family protein [Nocardioides sp. BP30]
MTTAPLAPPERPRFPTRFRAGEQRNIRIGRGLRLLARVDHLDAGMMDRIGRGFHERDELAAALAEAIRMRVGHRDKVTMRQFRTALARGIDAVPDAPPALRDFFAEVEAVPDWVDRDRVERGAAVFRRMGRNAGDVLLQLSLIGGYRFGGPTDLLVRTDGLTGPATLRRLAETQKWGTSLQSPGALRQHEEAWRLTVHVRLMHALVNAEHEATWDSGRWGLPINQTDLASTLGLFDGVPLLGCRLLGVRITRREAEDYLHLWRYVGHLMGVHRDFLVEDEHDRHVLNYHLLRAQGELSESGPRLARAVVRAQRERMWHGWPAVLQPVRGGYEQERLLSMLTVFLGPTSMRELGLPARPPWAFGYLVPLNLLRHQVVGRTAVGRRMLEARGARTSRRVLASYFGQGAEGLGDLPVGRPA